ncbi:hypothetical protein [Niallia circulans]|uniref:hypothetical protein n=1 Tax=Niallia circulans TaxID=1397 RepID=UPI002E2166A0|nr:hypothetical protein [Niallia circulans]
MQTNCYLLRPLKVKKAINTFCRGAYGLYQDGPSVEEYSQHCQGFAILTKTVGKENS